MRRAIKEELLHEKHCLLGSEAIMKAAVAWVGIKRSALYIILFWITLSAMLSAPRLAEMLLGGIKWIPASIILVGLLSIVIFMGILNFIKEMLQHRLHTRESYPSLLESVELLILIIANIFVWDTSKKLRLTKLLVLVVGIASIVANQEILIILFGIMYLFLCIQTTYKVIFATHVLALKKVNPFEAIKDSMILTHAKHIQLWLCCVKSLIASTALFVCLWLIIRFISEPIFSTLKLPIPYASAEVFAFIIATGPSLLALISISVISFSKLAKHERSSRIIRKLLAKNIEGRENKKGKFAVKRNAKKSKRK
jgi:hypothetical protein